MFYAATEGSYLFHFIFESVFSLFTFFLLNSNPVKCLLIGV